MNALKKLIIIATSLFGTAYGDSFFDELCSVRIEGKAGYFTFADQKMRDVYKNGGYGVQLSGAYPLHDMLYLYGAVGYEHASGRSLHFKQKTTFWQIPVDLGLKAVFCFTPCLDWYGAIGPRYFFAHQRNHSQYVNKNLSKNGFGIFANTGVDYFFTNNSYLTLFGEYSYERIRPSSSKEGVHTRRIQVGGFLVGAGLGYQF